LAGINDDCADALGHYKNLCNHYWHGACPIVTCCKIANASRCRKLWHLAPTSAFGNVLMGGAAGNPLPDKGLTDSIEVIS
jgi:hypothetical protein